jgi:hypothetical protein
MGGVGEDAGQGVMPRRRASDSRIITRAAAPSEMDEALAG